METHQPSRSGCLETPSPRLLADGMLGRLAKWLRLMGYDTVYDSRALDDVLAHRARFERRLLLTRDHELARRKGLRALIVTSDVLEEQVVQVITQVGPPDSAPFSRCSVCNTLLEPITPAEAAAQVPPYVLKTQKKFRRCPSCGRIYWAGTHHEHMVDWLNHLGQRPAGR